jgi:hypothetical protein
LIHEYAFRLGAGDLDGVASRQAELRSARLIACCEAASARCTTHSSCMTTEPRVVHQLTNVTVLVDGDHATRSYFTVLR